MKLIRLACMASTIALAAPAWAQSAPTTDAKPVDAKPAATEPTVGDIIVTAQREKTLLSKTPVAIAAITGDG
ncbi:hypothetical protein ACKI1O_50465, partial [Streptomyces scabiei]